MIFLCFSFSFVFDYFNYVIECFHPTPQCQRTKRISVWLHNTTPICVWLWSSNWRDHAHHRREQTNGREIGLMICWAYWWTNERRTILEKKKIIGKWWSLPVTPILNFFLKSQNSDASLFCLEFYFVFDYMQCRSVTFNFHFSRV